MCRHFHSSSSNGAVFRDAREEVLHAVFRDAREEVMHGSPQSGQWVCEYLAWARGARSPGRCAERSAIIGQT
jgi:hypothetical protein